MVIAETAFQAGQIIGILILVVIVIGLARTFLRSDLTWSEKILGSKKQKADE